MADSEAIVEEIIALVGEDEFSLAQIRKAVSRTGGDVEDAMTLLLEGDISDSAEDDVDSAAAQELHQSAAVAVAIQQQPQPAPPALPSRTSEPSSALLGMFSESRRSRSTVTAASDRDSDSPLHGGLGGPAPPLIFSFETPSPDDIARYRLQLQRMHGSNDAETLKDEEIISRIMSELSISDSQPRQIPVPEIAESIQLQPRQDLAGAKSSLGGWKARGLGRRWHFYGPSFSGNHAGPAPQRLEAGAGRPSKSGKAAAVRAVSSSHMFDEVFSSRSAAAEASLDPFVQDKSGPGVAPPASAGGGAATSSRSSRKPKKPAPLDDGVLQYLDTPIERGEDEAAAFRPKRKSIAAPSTKRARFELPSAVMEYLGIQTERRARLTRVARDQRLAEKSKLSQAQLAAARDSQAQVEVLERLGVEGQRAKPAEPAKGKKQPQSKKNAAAKGAAAASAEQAPAPHTDLPWWQVAELANATIREDLNVLVLGPHKGGKSALLAQMLISEAADCQGQRPSREALEQFSLLEQFSHSVAAAESTKRAALAQFNQLRGASETPGDSIRGPSSACQEPDAPLVLNLPGVARNLRFVMPHTSCPVDQATLLQAERKAARAQAKRRHKDSVAPRRLLENHCTSHQNGLLAAASVADMVLLVLPVGLPTSAPASGAEQPWVLELFRQLSLLKQLGLTRVVVAVTHMDSCGYSRQRFTSMSAFVSNKLLKPIGLNGAGTPADDDQQVVFVPVSNGDVWSRTVPAASQPLPVNLTAAWPPADLSPQAPEHLREAKDKLAWFKGTPLLPALQAMNSPRLSLPKPQEAPLRLVVDSVRDAKAGAGSADCHPNHHSTKQIIARLESGSLAVGDLTLSVRGRKRSADDPDFCLLRVHRVEIRQPPAQASLAQLQARACQALFDPQMAQFAFPGFSSAPAGGPQGVTAVANCGLVEQRLNRELECAWTQAPVALPGDLVRLTVCANTDELLLWLVQGGWRNAEVDIADDLDAEIRDRSAASDLERLRRSQPHRRTAASVVQPGDVLCEVLRPAIPRRQLRGVQLLSLLPPELLRDRLQLGTLRLVPLGSPPDLPFNVSLGKDLATRVATDSREEPVGLEGGFRVRADITEDYSPKVAARRKQPSGGKQGHAELYQLAEYLRQQRPEDEAKENASPEESRESRFWFETCVELSVAAVSALNPQQQVAAASQIGDDDAPLVFVGQRCRGNGRQLALLTCAEQVADSLGAHLSRAAMHSLDRVREVIGLCVLPELQ